MSSQNVVRIPQSQAPEPEIEPTFDDFYALYPRKVARKDAARAWARLDLPSRVAAFLGLLDWRRVWEFEQSRRDDAANYLPYPASWLNGERWTDELPAGFRRRPADVAVAGVGGVERAADLPRTPMPAHALEAIRKIREGAKR